MISKYENLHEEKKITKTQSDAIYQRMMNYEKEKLRRKEKIKRESLKNEILNCTHKPKVHKGRGRGMELVDRVNEIIEMRQQKINSIKYEERRKIENEMKMQCTFTPEINKESQFYK